MQISIPLIQFDFSSPEVEDIQRCLYALYSTHEGSQPLDRELGLNLDFLDYPAAIVKNRYALEVIQKTERYEPRVRVISVTYKDSTLTHPEILEPIITIGRREDE